MGHVDVDVIIGDARETLPAWNGKADAWFLDGFSPAKNPELWNEAIMAQVGAHTAQGGTCATYTAAGFVRRGLEAAGFTDVAHVVHGFEGELNEQFKRSSINGWRHDGLPWEQM